MGRWATLMLGTTATLVPSDGGLAYPSGLHSPSSRMGISTSGGLSLHC